MEVYFKADPIRINNFVTELKNTEGNALVSLYTGMAQAICFFVEKGLELNYVFEKVTEGPLSVFLNSELLINITNNLVKSREVFSDSRKFRAALASQNGLSSALAVDWVSVLGYQDKFFSGYQFVSDSLRIVINYNEIVKEKKPLIDIR